MDAYCMLCACGILGVGGSSDVDDVELTLCSGVPLKVSCLSLASSIRNRSESSGGIFHLKSELLVQYLDGKSRQVVLCRVFRVFDRVILGVGMNSGWLFGGESVDVDEW